MADKQVISGVFTPVVVVDFLKKHRWEKSHDAIEWWSNEDPRTWDSEGERRSWLWPNAVALQVCMDDADQQSK